MAMVRRTATGNVWQDIGVCLDQIADPPKKGMGKAMTHIHLEQAICALHREATTIASCSEPTEEIMNAILTHPAWAQVVPHDGSGRIVGLWITNLMRLPWPVVSQHVLRIVDMGFDINTRVETWPYHPLIAAVAKTRWAAVGSLGTCGDAVFGLMGMGALLNKSTTVLAPHRGPTRDMQPKLVSDIFLEMDPEAAQHLDALMAAWCEQKNLQAAVGNHGAADKSAPKM